MLENVMASGFRGRGSKGKKMILESSIRLSQEFDSTTRSLWFGAQSFEERCVGSLIALERAGIQMNAGVVITYVTNVQPVREAEVRAEKSWAAIKNFQPTVFADGIQRLP